MKLTDPQELYRQRQPPLWLVADKKFKHANFIGEKQLLLVLLELMGNHPNKNKKGMTATNPVRSTECGSVLCVCVFLFFEKKKNKKKSAVWTEDKRRKKNFKSKCRVHTELETSASPVSHRWIDERNPTSQKPGFISSTSQLKWA